MMSRVHEIRFGIAHHAPWPRVPDRALVLDTIELIGASICDKYSGSMKITTHLDHIGHWKTASGTTWSNSWTHRVFIINTRRDDIGGKNGRW